MKISNPLSKADMSGLDVHQDEIAHTQVHIHTHTLTYRQTQARMIAKYFRQLTPKKRFKKDLLRLLRSSVFSVKVLPIQD
jgi:hypothetical protein